jgi:hypothetical protein
VIQQPSKPWRADSHGHSGDAEGSGNAFAAPTEFAAQWLQKNAKRKYKQRAEDHSTESGGNSERSRINSRFRVSCCGAVE